MKFKSPKALLGLCSATLHLLVQVPLARGAEQPTEDIFKKVFGSRGAPQNAKSLAIQLTLFDNQTEIGALASSLSGEQVSFGVDDFIKLLETIVDDITLNRIKATANKEGRFLLSDLGKTGLNGSYEKSALSVRLQIPLELRRLSTMDLSRRSRGQTDKALRPAPWSSFLNIRGGMERLGSNASNGNSPFQGPRLSFDSAINVSGWVLEGAFNWNATNTTKNQWQRENIRMVHDDPERSVRYLAGDTLMPSAGFQPAVPVLGLAIGKQFEIDPYKNIYPSARQDFSVQNTSTVKIIQNGQEIQNLMLNPGNYSLRNIPLAIGANAIQLQITDEAGRITTRTLDFFFDSTLLAPGVHDFGYGIGAPLKFEGTERNYRTGEMIISGYHRLGLNNSTTAGINFRANSSQQLLGGELTRVMPIGTASIQTATSNHASSGTGHALIVQLKSENSSQKSNTGGSYWLTQLSQYTERFSTSPESSTVNSVNTELAMRYSTTLTDNISLSVSGLHQRLRTAEQSRFTEAATIRYRLDNRSSLWLSFEKRIRPESGYRADYVAFLGFRHTFEKIRGDASISYDSSRRATTIQTQASTGAPGQQWNGGFRLYSGDDNSLAAANLAYAGSRFEWSSLHETINSALGGAGRSRDFASFGTALIVADGLFSISRPVNDSFYIVKPNPRIADKSLGINPSNNIYQAVSDWAGPPASSWLTSYIENSVAVDILDSTPGYDPGNDRPVLLPTYKSGIIVPIGTAAATMVSGFILNEKGLPLALGAGRLVSSDSPPATFPFFTNRRGSFRSEPLPPGNYAIMVDGSAKPLGRFSIKPEDEGIMEIGQYRIQ